MKFVITGICRGGTGYMASLAQALQYDVPHEQLGRDGICSWCWAAPPGPVPYGQAVIPHTRDNFIQVVREPWAVISSIVTTYIANDPLTRNFMRQHIVLPPDNAPALEIATAMVCRWQEFINQQKPDLVVQVERAAQSLPNYISHHDNTKLMAFHPPARDTNTRDNSLELSHGNVMKLPGGMLDELNQYCIKYQYPLVTA